MHKRLKKFFRAILAIATAFTLSVTAFAATSNGRSKTTTIGSRSYTGYNTITVLADDAKAGTTLNCDVFCSAGELAIYPMLQDEYGLVQTVSWIYNTDTVRSFYASTPTVTVGNGTYYSGGGVMGWNTGSNTLTAFSLYVSPGLTISNKSNRYVSSAYRINAKGQTFGRLNDLFNLDECPDLIAANGTNGVKGYVYASDLFEDLPSSPEEAAALMTNRDYILGRCINLYASDGVSIIGCFNITGLAGVTIYEDNVSITYDKDGTVTKAYGDKPIETSIW